MSLDVSLIGKEEEQEVECYACRNVHKEIVREQFFDSNITYNLGRMADAAGIYEHLWRPEEIGITKAKELVEPLTQGLERMKADPQKFKQYDATNGWGTYEQFIPWIAQYLQACKDYPEATVSVSR